MKDHDGKACETEQPRRASLAEPGNQRQISAHLHEFNGHPQGKSAPVHDGDKKRISRRPGEAGPTVVGAPIPMLGRIHVPKGVELSRAAVNVFVVNEPEFEGRDKTKSNRESSTAINPVRGSVTGIR